MEKRPLLSGELTGVAVEKIIEYIGDRRVERAHLLSPRIASQPEKYGDGYIALKGRDGRGYTAVVVGISLGRQPGTGIMNKDNKVITEARLLKDLTELIVSSANEDRLNVNSPEILLNFLCERFNPSYMDIWRNGLDWGFSACAASFDPESKVVKIASIGTNIIAQEAKPNSQTFHRVLRPNSSFFMLYPNKISRAGGKAPIVQGIIPNIKRVLLATDGIVVQEGFLKRQVMDLSQDPETLLGPNREGLYVVIDAI